MIRSTDDQPTTILERFAGAIDSSNLKLKESGGDIDVIISAALIDDDLALTLIRLQIEYDRVCGAHRAAQTAMLHGEEDARRQRERATMQTAAVEKENASERARTILKQAERAALTAHVMLKGQLPSLRQATVMVGHFALREAHRLRYARPPEYILRLALAVLDVHISPTCRTCMGRGFVGDGTRGEHVMQCRPCRTSGTRRDSLGDDDVDRAFAGTLLLLMNELMARGEHQLSAARANVRAAKAQLMKAEAQAGAHG